MTYHVYTISPDGITTYVHEFSGMVQWTQEKLNAKRFSAIQATNTVLYLGSSGVDAKKSLCYNIKHAVRNMVIL